MDKGRINNHAFTLLEIIITTVIIVVGVVSVVRTISLAVAASYSVEVRTVALNLAQQQMETLFNTAYSSIASGSDSPSGFSGYGRTWTVVDNTNYKTVTVTVTATVYKGQTTSVSLVSYIANQAPYN